MPCRRAENLSAIYLLSSRPLFEHAFHFFHKAPTNAKPLYLSAAATITPARPSQPSRPPPPATAAPQIIRNDHIMPLSSSTAKSPGHHRGRSRGGGGSNHASSSSTGGATATTILPTSLVKQCLQLHHPDQRYTNDAIELSSEFLRLLVIEARRRAAIEVSECVCHHYSWKLNASIYLGRTTWLPC